MPEHVHKLKRGRYKTGTYFFKCTECTFVAVANQIIGRMTRCWRCGEPFIVNRNDTRWAKPVCPMCRNKPEQTEEKHSVDLMDALMEDILKEDKK